MNTTENITNMNKQEKLQAAKKRKNKNSGKGI